MRFSQLFGKTLRHAPAEADTQFLTLTYTLPWLRLLTVPTGARCVCADLNLSTRF